MMTTRDLAASGGADETLARGADVRQRLPTKGEYVGRVGSRSALVTAWGTRSSHRARRPSTGLATGDGRRAALGTRSPAAAPPEATRPYVPRATGDDRRPATGDRTEAVLRGRGPISHPRCSPALRSAYSASSSGSEGSRRRVGLASVLENPRLAHPELHERPAALAA